MAENPLIGQTVKAVFLADDGGAIRFDLDGGGSVVALADGDCCSKSWIEQVQGIDQLVGSRVVSVEDIDMPDLGSNRGEEEPLNRYGHCEDEMQYYGCKVVTEKGFAVIDFRNSSNGYYGGNLSWGDDYFYGGVHGQNVSSQRWIQIDA